MKDKEMVILKKCKKCFNHKGMWDETTVRCYKDEDIVMALVMPMERDGKFGTLCPYKKVRKNTGLSR